MQDKNQPKKKVEKDQLLKLKKEKLYAVKYSGGQHIIKDVDTVGRTVTGFFNTCNYFDSDSDIILDGAAKKSITERGPESNATAKIKHALNHNLTQLPGKLKVLAEKEINGIKGIYFETKMSDTTLGNDTLKNYIDKVYDNHSIGFKYLDINYIDKEGEEWSRYVDMCHNPEDMEAQGYAFLIKELALWEGSTVAFGANQLTPFLGVKSGNKEAYKLALYEKVNQFGKILSSGTQSDDMMKTFEIHALQLKQMINELTDEMPLIIGHRKEALIDQSKIQKNIDFTFLTNNFNL